MNDAQPHDDGAAPVSFGRSFVHSEAFRSLFREGMNLVEATAAYLDGDGREEARRLPRMMALTYASESMRLTTRLMQLASWLLLQRAVVEGEISSDEAERQRMKVRLADQPPPEGLDDAEQMPLQLRALIDKSLQLQARVLHLDALIGETGGAPPLPNAIALQHELLQNAFSA